MSLQSAHQSVNMSAMISFFSTRALAIAWSYSLSHLMEEGPRTIPVPAAPSTIADTRNAAGTGTGDLKIFRLTTIKRLPKGGTENGVQQLIGNHNILSLGIH